MDVIDFVKQEKGIYAPKSEPVIVDIPEMQFLMIDGEGAPDPSDGTEEHIGDFQRATGALYGIAYSIKMAYKGDSQPKGYHNFKVPPLDGLWWMKDGGEFDMTKPSDWRWTIMIRVPDFVTKDVVSNYADMLVKKKNSDVYKDVRLEKFHEGLCVQIMHIGSYASEGPNIKKMHDYAEKQGYKLHGKHHEIYFGDPRRTAPERLKTVLRQPIKK